MSDTFYREDAAPWPGGAGVLTIEVLNEVAERLRNLASPPAILNSWSGPWQPASPIFSRGREIIESPYLTVTEDRSLSAWERFRVWVERLADEAEIYYYFPRVQRTVTKPSPDCILMGNQLLCHPALARRIRAHLLTGKDAPPWS